MARVWQSSKTNVIGKRLVGEAHQSLRSVQVQWVASKTVGGRPAGDQLSGHLLQGAANPM